MTSISDTNVVNAPGGLVELGHTDIGSTVVVSSTTEGVNGTTLTNTLTIVSDGSPLLIDFFHPRLRLGASASGSYVITNLIVDGADAGRINFQYNISNIATEVSCHGSRKLTLSAGVHTLKLTAFCGSAVTTNSFYIDGLGLPGYFRISKIIQASQLIVQTPNAPLVTSLPSNAIDGQEVRYLADNTNGIVWNFRYRAGSSSAYKWEFIGGSALKNSYSTQITANNSGFTSCNCSITLPLAGDYDFDFGAMMESTYNSGQTNVYLNTTGASSSYVISSRNQDTSTRVDSSGASYARIAGISANTSYNLWLNITNATYGWGNYFWLKTVPIRVSA